MPDDNDDMKDEYDIRGGERGKYASRYAAGAKRIVRAIIVEPGAKPRRIEVEDELENWQKLVGGYVQSQRLSDRSLLLCYEDAKIVRNPPPFNAIVEGHEILGTFVIVRDSDGEFVSVGLDDEKRWLG